MSYSDDAMVNLTRALREFSKSAAALERLACAIERQNELKSIELNKEKIQEPNEPQDKPKGLIRSFSSRS